MPIEEDKALTELLDECSQMIMLKVAKFMRDKVQGNQSIVNRFTHVLPLCAYHCLSKMISDWIHDKNQIEDYKNRMEEDLKRYLGEFREKF